MDSQKLLNWGGLCIATSYLALTYDKSFAFDRPVQSAILALGLCGISIIIATKISPIAKLSPRSDQQYTAIPLEDRRLSRSRSSSADVADASGDSAPAARSLRASRLSFLLLITAVCFRVEVARRVLKDVQCTGKNYQPFVPLAVALYDYWRMRRSGLKSVDDDKLRFSTYGAIGSYFVKGRLRSVLSCLLLGCGAFLAALWGSPPHSTYICAKTLSGFKMVPTLQAVGALLDAFICVLLAQLLDSSPQIRGRAGGVVAVGWACMLSSIIWTFIGLIVYCAMPEHRYWIMSLPRTYAWSLLKGIFVICIIVNFALRTAYHVGVTTTTFGLVVTCIYSTSLASAWLNNHPYPPTSVTGVLLSILLIVASAALYIIAESSREDQDYAASRSSSIRFSFGITAFVAALLLGPATLWLLRRHEVTYHPIDLLIHDARAQHETWLKQSSSSESLDAAVQSYRMRYNRDPPPNFDAWYRYANVRSSVVVDDFDNIYRDTLPFWSLSPAEIRQRTWEAIANPENGIGGISIRDGKAEISPTVPGTHRWMLDGVVQMVEKFGERIPDMDLAFNLNDECRIAVPYEKIEPMRQAAERAATVKTEGLTTRFSVDRASGWKSIPEEPLEDTKFEERSFQATFHAYGAVGCPPSSSARVQRLWDLHDLCTTCAYPHSLGQFLSNWTLSASVCHQPDLADLHGLYLSPAAFKGSHELVPVFSQSKAYGFNDILYPSAWNYMDKVTYAPTDEFPDLPLAQKRNTLFWRGVTSEGVSPGTGTWKGMTRQRFVHIVNNITTPQIVLLPQSTANSKEQLAYQSIQPSDLKELLSTDVILVDQIVRCGGRDCPDQEREFGLGERIDFQAHWGNAYLYDGDGAGFSGRFLPFLQSRSLPFKTALFREWYEGRLTPWLHFVPLDLRLHGLWSTLAYFAGVDGKVGGKDVKWERRIKEAEMIAESGRDWAEKVLRKEDMEIYFFRLLLEWGRLTDDRRDDLGFVG